MFLKGSISSLRKLCFRTGLQPQDPTVEGRNISKRLRELMELTVAIETRFANGDGGPECEEN